LNFLLTLSRGAEMDIIEARTWYELRGRDLGTAFMRALDACLAAIERSPESFPKVHNDARRALLRRYPYAIFYYLLKDEIVILACAHTSRRPEYWQNRD
jgi:plasmid stabilization system protein ParE